MDPAAVIALADAQVVKVVAAEARSPERAIADHPGLVAIALQRDPERLAQALIAHLDTTEKIVTDGYRRILADGRLNAGDRPDLRDDAQERGR